MLNHVDDAEHWRERAAQMRVLVTTMKQIEAQAIMARLAEDYDKLADHAELRANGEIPAGEKSAASAVKREAEEAGKRSGRARQI